jgi:hypothetical protein
MEAYPGLRCELRTGLVCVANCELVWFALRTANWFGLLTKQVACAGGDSGNGNWQHR